MKSSPPPSRPISAGKNQYQKETADYLLAENPLTPPDILETLPIKEGFTDSRLARNPSSTTNVFSRILNSGGWYAKVELTKNSKVPKEILEQLSNDPNPQVREAARTALSTNRY